MYLPPLVFAVQIISRTRVFDPPNFHIIARGGSPLSAKVSSAHRTSNLIIGLPRYTLTVFNLKSRTKYPVVALS